MGNEARFNELGEAVVVDVETTGLDKDTDRIISVAALRVDFSAVQPNGDADAEVKYFTADVDPGIPIHKDASAVHGIRDEDVRGRQSFAEIADDLREFIGDRPLVGHNVAFDKRFLHNELKRSNGTSIWKNKPYCTQKRAGYYFWRTKSGGKKPSLDHALKRFGVEGRKQSSHGAYEDALLTLQLAARLKQLDELPGEAPDRWHRMFGEPAGHNAGKREEREQRAREEPTRPKSSSSDQSDWGGLLLKVVLFGIAAAIVVALVL